MEEFGRPEYLSITGETTQTYVYNADSMRVQIKPREKRLEGYFEDPRSFVAGKMAAPTGVEPVFRP